MDIVSATAYETIRVNIEEDICFIQIHRPEANNAINERLIQELSVTLAKCEESAKIVVLEGLPDVFCFGADFKELEERREQNPGQLYDIWLQLACGSFISVAHVRGRTNAGGIGFVAACDLVICEEKAVFSLSELLFGLMPACVLPFLIRRVGFAKANYMTLMTQPISSRQALEWGLVDVCEDNSCNLLRKNLLRLRRLGKTGVTRYKRYIASLESLAVSRPQAIAANLEVFSDTNNLEMITRYIKTGKFPWEGA